MRKDGKSQYQLKKEKLLEIKKYLQMAKRDLWESATIKSENETLRHYYQRIWELVKDE